MKSLLSRRPSPALVIACIALFVSLGGVSYGVATGFIDSREIKNNEIRSGDLRNNEIRTRDLRNNEVRGIDVRNSTIQSRDIAINGVQGVDVREDTLGKVPSATAADTATTAAGAAAVDGYSMARIAYAGEELSDFTEILNAGGLRLEARCVAGPDIEVRANPAAPGAVIMANLHPLGGADEPSSVDDGSFNPGDNTFVVPNAGFPGGTVRIEAIAADGSVICHRGHRPRGRGRRARLHERLRPRSAPRCSRPAEDAHELS